MRLKMRLQRRSADEIRDLPVGRWGDDELLDAVRHFDQARDLERAAAVIELILRSPDHVEYTDYSELYMRLVEHDTHAEAYRNALRWAHARIAYGEQHETRFVALGRANAWRDLATVYLSAGDVIVGLRMFTRILRSDPADIWTYNVIGHQARHAGLSPLAVDAIEVGRSLRDHREWPGLRKQLEEMQALAEAGPADRMSDVDPQVRADFEAALELATAADPISDPEQQPYLPPITGLLDSGAGGHQAAAEEIMSAGPVMVPELIRLAYDPDVAPAANQRAVALLRQLHAEERAELDVLGHWLERADGAWHDMLVDVFGKVGFYTPSELADAARRTDYAAPVRTAAVSAFGELVARRPDLRPQLVVLVRDLLTRPQAGEGDEEQFIGFLISAALDIGLRELRPEIEQAFEEDRVDRQIVGPDSVTRHWGKSRRARDAPATPPSADSGPMSIDLRCTACRRTREHTVHFVIVDVTTQHSRAEGDEVDRCPYIMDHEIVCPKCGARDEYELGPRAPFVLLGPQDVSTLQAIIDGEQPADQRPNPRLFFGRYAAFGTPMHPLDGLAEYRRRIEADPENAELHLRMGNLLRMLLRHEAALAAHRRAYELDPEQAEIAFALAMSEHDAGHRDGAAELYHRVIELEGGFVRGLLRGMVPGRPDTFADGAVQGLWSLSHDQLSPWSWRVDHDASDWVRQPR